jgi:hypothetical protein
MQVQIHGVLPAYNLLKIIFEVMPPQILLLIQMHTADPPHMWGCASQCSFHTCSYTYVIIIKQDTQTHLSVATWTIL